jgi:hypothetical protein
MSSMPKLEAFHDAQNRLEKAHRENERLRREAISELLAERGRIDSQLRSIGYELRQSDSDESPSDKAPRKRSSRKRCPYCDMSGHDGRAHRAQGNEKRKFTASELYARGWGIPPRPAKASS